MSNKSIREAAKASSSGKAAKPDAPEATDTDTAAPVEPETAPGVELTSNSSTSNKRARFYGPEDDSASFTQEELAQMSRSERKRHREKKRRSDVNKGFDELMTLLLEIDPVVRAEAEDRARRGQWKGDMGAQEDNLLSRVDLIRRTVRVVRKIHEENEQRKVIILELMGGQGADGRAAALSGRVRRDLLPSLSGNAGGGGAPSVGVAASSSSSTGSAPAAADRPSLFSASALSQAAASAGQGDPLTSMGLLGQQQHHHRQQQAAAAAAQQRLASLGFAPSDFLGFNANPFSGFGAAGFGGPQVGSAHGAMGGGAWGGAAGGATGQRLALLEQLAQERDAANMIAKARFQQQHQGGGRPF